MSSTMPPFSACPWCGADSHGTACPRVRKFEFYENMTIRSVEFWEPTLDALLDQNKAGVERGA